MSVEKEGPITVVKRDGSTVEGCVDKIAERLISLVEGLNTKFVDPASVAAKVYRGLYDGVSTVEIDELSAQCAASLTTVHPDYSLLAGRIAVSNLHKQTMVDSNHSFSDTVYSLRHYKLGDGRGASLIGDITYKVVEEHKEVLNAAVDYSRDMSYDYFGFKTLERSYLLKIDGRIVERPQDMIMRVAVGIWGDDIPSVLETYNMMSLKTFTHASPTLFNAGTPKPQCSSCFLVQMKDDSIEGIYDTLKTCALISKSAGGIGLSVHNIRASGTYIAGTNGTSNGLIPMLRVYNNTARYVDQGGNKRPGAFAIYLEPWHADIGDFLELKKNTGQEELRARDLFYGLWICDLFMKRVEANATWSLMCPRESTGLNECHGEEFEALYEKYEAEGRFKKQLPARELWNKILESQIETGTPYMMYKDACNRKSNQKNLGTISSSNLCTEIVEYTAPDEVAVCNLASISLPRFVDPVSKTFDFDGLMKVTKRVAKNLDRVIDINFYPVPEARNSNMRHRPIGIGVQGLADTFALMRFPFDSPEAKALNKDIFEAMYFAACTASHQLAVKDGAYSSFQGSPASKGELQFDLWGVSPSGKWDWDSLKADIARDGLRNSLLMAPMPTASTSQILGNNECFEPFTSNLYTRRVLAGTFQCVNKHLLRDLIDLGIWNDSLKEKIVARNGSVQGINSIPKSIQALYKTAWEMKQKVLIDMAADRGAFIDQSQSFSVFFNEASFAKLSSMHFYSWKIGLKTGMYYLRTRPAVDPVKISVSVDEAMAARAALTAEAREKADEEAKAAIVCSLENKDACTMCSG